MARGKHKDTELTPRATDETEPAGAFQMGDTFRCDECGMELEITVGCDCADPDGVMLQCCHQEMTRV
jgi:hypothetical protein